MFWRARRKPVLPPATPDITADSLAGLFPAVDAAEALRGRVTLAGRPAVELRAGPHGGVDWLFDPHGNRSWSLNLHALRWMGRLVVEYERAGGEEYLDRATAIAEDWVRANPRGGHGVSEWAWAEHAVALRGPALVCLSAHVRASWLAASLAEHAAVLADPALYREGHNHGLDQDIALLLIARRLGDDERMGLAVRRMTASAELAVDEQGALHEQAPRYGVYVHRRMGTAIRIIRGCGLPVPAPLTARRAVLESYIAHATQPDGRIVALGDSPADARAPRLTGDRPTVAIFEAGYVFGRTAWGDPRSAYYSIRFGPGRRLHGHEDHLGVTYQAGGHDVLVEGGFDSYEKTAFRDWTISPEAHNVPVVAGAAFRPGTATVLESAAVEPGRQVYRLHDDAYGVRRTRTVLVVHDPDLLAVLDEAPAGLSARWHFAPALRPVATGEGRVVLADGERRVTLVRLAPPGDRPPPDPLAERGQVCTGHLKRAEATVVVSPAARRSLTLIVPGDDAPEIAVAPDGGLTVRTRGRVAVLPPGLAWT
ncbi:heparinase II/III family protein [Spongiactinospora sp. TRM90649]|uniref:heparinase II/III domain-containing protein n=1 Tax=Spongiactinospora sp. TRM90649 TaxID=3031114 RepID=UPI0023F7F2E3|nr:heparinase II/III family protein [Spongiactinospora sp. TRM90649]MDF5755359.1 heparinase II/III family protein [Spongiactinospora sp. TRM90649]